ncbi:MAG: HAD hydrolase family protein, partial [Selenomonas sp.]|nr:HAD hydrolase family protein [Selenomonas sp.]
MIKMIFSDMDGTLLDGKGQVPAWFDALAAELAARGVRFAPASGRQYFS